jgi:hypothetical protein
MQGAPKYDGD